MEKCFNIAGPCFPDEHYMLPALERLPGIMRIVEQRSYFVLHAARQSGKTTALMALAEEINAKGEMIALYFTVETVQRFTDPRSWNRCAMPSCVIPSSRTLSAIPVRPCPRFFRRRPGWTSRRCFP